MVDLNGDGRVDIYRPGRWYMNDGPSGFTDARTALGIPYTNEWGAVFGDIDDDGRLDAFIISAPSNQVLFRQENDGHMAAVAGNGGIDMSTVFAQGSVFLDAENDGDLDLFVADDLTVHRFYQNTGNGEFQDASNQVALPYERQGYGAMAGDYDNDGDADILIGACANGLDRSRNVLYRNDGDRFTETAEFLGIDDENAAWAAVWFDYNNDGWLDHFIANMPITGRTGENLLFRNDGTGGFIDATATSGVAGDPDAFSTGAVAADFDNDGWQDLLVTANTSPFTLWRNNQDGTFTAATNLGIPGLHSFAVAAGDVNDDGWIDLFFPSDAGDKLYLNNGGSNHWLRLHLRGRTSNHFGVGARIEIETGLQTQIREITAGDGMTTQSHNLSAHVGLGDATTATVRVRWPSGIVDEHRDVAADAAYTLVEDGWIAPVGTEPTSLPSARLALDTPTPNPARARTALTYRLPHPGPVRLAVYDALGREVALLASGTATAGRHTVSFDGTRLPSGVYVVRLTHEAGTETQPLTLIR